MNISAQSNELQTRLFWLRKYILRSGKRLGVGAFLLAGLAALVIACLTVSGQSIKAAVANPVESLRDE